MQLTLKHDMSFSQLRAELPAKAALADDLDAATATAAAQTRADLAKSPGLWQGGQRACWPGFHPKTMMVPYGTMPRSASARMK